MAFDLAGFLVALALGFAINIIPYVAFVAYIIIGEELVDKRNGKEQDNE